MTHFHHTNRPLVVVTLKVLPLVASLYPKLTQIKQIIITNMYLKLILVANVINILNMTSMMTIVLIDIAYYFWLSYKHYIYKQPAENLKPNAYSKTKCNSLSHTIALLPI